MGFRLEAVALQTDLLVTTNHGIPRNVNGWSGRISGGIDWTQLDYEALPAVFKPAVEECGSITRIGAEVSRDSTVGIDDLTADRKTVYPAVAFAPEYDHLRDGDFVPGR